MTKEISGRCRLDFFPVLFCILFLLLTVSEAEDFDNSVKKEISDSIKIVTVQNLKMGGERFGNNGFGISMLLVDRFLGNSSNGSFAFGSAISGDILTGVPYIHITPRISYWNLVETLSFRDTTSSTERIVTVSDHEIGVNFHVSLVSDRFSKESVRLFTGMGPSMHIGVQNTREVINTIPYGRTISGVKHGLGVMGGVEWPFSIFASLIMSLSYEWIYDWDRLDKKLLILSVGIAI